jgi:hypothetical protein
MSNKKTQTKTPVKVTPPPVKQAPAKNAEETPDEEYEPIFFEPMDSYDADRLFLDDPVNVSYTIGKTFADTAKGTKASPGIVVDNCTSKGYYLDENDNKRTVYVKAPSQQCFGINLSHDINETNKVLETAKGLQLAFPMTSIKTVKTPTQEELWFKQLLDDCREATCRQAIEEAERDEPLVCPPAYNSIIGSKNQKTGQYNTNKCVKPVYDYKKDQTTKLPDMEKPQTFYAKLVTSGKGDKMKVLTSIYPEIGNEDEVISPFTLIDKDGMGIFTPCFKWTGVFWGSHGQKSTFGCSLQFKVAESLYKKAVGMQKISTPYRMLKSTPKAQVEEVHESDTPNPAFQNGNNSDEDNQTQEQESNDPLDRIPPKKVGVKKAGVTKVAPITQKKKKPIAPKKKIVKPVTPPPESDEENNNTDEE